MRRPARPRRPDATAAAAAAPGPPDFAAQLVPLDPGLYAFSLAASSPRRAPFAGLALPAVHVTSPPHPRTALEITDQLGRAGAWLGDSRRMLFVRSPGGGAALVTAYLARDPGAEPLELEIRRVSGGEDWHGDTAARPTARPLPPLMTLRIAAPDRATGPVTIDVVAHIRAHGDVRFVDTPWIGRLGGGSWIEAFTIFSRNRAVAGAIEYKGLSASGAETPWLPCGSPCGTRGRGMPLIGFAVRQQPTPGGPRFDCEYSGYFQSGETAGPLRNGAPCLSPRDNDPLEGMQLRITPRPPGPAASPPTPTGDG